MMIKGYSEYYVSTVMESIAVMYDHAIHDLYFDADVITREDTQTGWTVSKESGRVSWYEYSNN